MRWIRLVVTMTFLMGACSKERVVHRANCEVCHLPRDESGTPHGIEAAHPWVELECVTCHGGQDWICDGTLTGLDGGVGENPRCDGNWVYDKDRAHVAPGDGPSFLKNLSSQELDEVDRAYLRFINPGDLRVVDTTCGRCHTDITYRVRTSVMAHTSGEVTVARYRAGAQPTPHGVFSAVDVSAEPNPPCGVAELTRLDPPPLDPASSDPTTELSTANAQDQYIVKSCLRCHLNDFGENRFTGDFRSSGCTACHMEYADNGLSESNDPRISHETVPHPRTHELTTAPTTTQCTHCHYRGGRIGMSFQGYRESGGPGFNPPNPEVLGVAQHGHDAAYYLTDEDNSNDFDETPPDVHFEAGMHCVDCHYEEEVHGDGHLYADTQCAVGTECEDCHGTLDAYAEPSLLRDNFYVRDGRRYLRTKVTGLELEVPQVRDLVTPGSPSYSEAAAMAMDATHLQDLECYTCHSGWTPSCYGCHVTVDMSVEGRYQSTGRLTPGRPTGSRRAVVLNDLVLLWNSDGKLAPSMPSERFFLTVLDEAGQPTRINSRPRTFDDGTGPRAGFGQRAFNPHTVRRRSSFMSCDRCHSVGSVEAPTNEALLDITHGFGSDRFIERGCDVSNADDTCDPDTDWTSYRLDAIIDRAGNPLVVVGHPDPQVSRPLSLEEIARMRAIVVDDSYLPTPIPADARTNPEFPAAQNVE